MINETDYNLVSHLPLLPCVMLGGETAGEARYTCDQRPFRGCSDSCEVQKLEKGYAECEPQSLHD